MTSPNMVSLNLSAEMPLPNNNDTIFRIQNHREDIDDTKMVIGKRDISLFPKGKEYTEEVILFPSCEYIVNDNDNDEEIIESFHDDDIEFI